MEQFSFSLADIYKSLYAEDPTVLNPIVDGPDHKDLEAVMASIAGPFKDEKEEYILQKSALKELKSILDAAEKERTALKDMGRQLFLVEDECQQVERDCTNLEKVVEESVTDVSKLMKKLESLEWKRDSELSDFDLRMQKMKSYNDAKLKLSSERPEYQANEELRSKVEVLRGQRDELLEKRSTFGNEGKLELEVERLEKENKEKGEHLCELRKTLYDLEEEEKSLEIEIEILPKRNAACLLNLETRLARARQQLDFQSRRDLCQLCELLKKTQAQIRAREKHLLKRK